MRYGCTMLLDMHTGLPVQRSTMGQVPQVLHFRWRDGLQVDSSDGDIEHMKKLCAIIGHEWDDDAANDEGRGLPAQRLRDPRGD